jgi:hypothetical protein
MGELPPGPPPMIATSKIFVENRNVLWKVSIRSILKI